MFVKECCCRFECDSSREIRGPAIDSGADAGKRDFRNAIVMRQRQRIPVAAGEEPHVFLAQARGAVPDRRDRMNDIS